MKKGKVILSLFLLLMLSPPWFFSGEVGVVILGFPAWAIWVVAVTAVYAISLVVCFEKYWECFAGESDEESEDWL